MAESTFRKCRPTLGPRPWRCSFTTGTAETVLASRAGGLATSWAARRWSHNTDKGMTPPSAGWKIPWDGQVRPTLVVAPKGQLQRQESEQNLKNLSEQVAKVDSEAKTAASQAQALAGDLSIVTNVQQAEELLTPHSTALIEVQKKLSEAQRGQPGDIVRNFVTLANQLRMTQQSLTQELNKFRNARTQAEAASKAAEADARDGAAYQEMAPEVSQKLAAAEEGVEKAVATHGAIAAAGDDIDQAKKGVDETEAAVRSAEQVISEARMLISTKQNLVKRFESVKVREKATQELSGLMTKLQVAQTKLVPLKSARHELAQKQMAQQVVGEISEKLAPAEKECAEAEAAAAPLQEGEVDEEKMAEIEQAVRKATDSITVVMRIFNQKKMGAAPAVMKELVPLEERLKAADAKMTRLKNAKKEAGERSALQSFLKDAQEKLQAVQDGLAKAQDAETPFLMGVEELPIERTSSAVKACETLATSTSTAASIARMFLGTKLVEAKKFSPSLSSEATAKIKEFQAQLESLTKRLNDLKVKTAERKKAAMTKESQVQVKQAEALAEKVAEAAALFDDDSKLSSLTTEQVRKAQDATSKAEEAASQAISEAKRAVSHRQAEAKVKDSSGALSQELEELLGRLSAAQSNVNKHMRNCNDIDRRIRARQTSEESLSKISHIEAEMEKVTGLIEKITPEDSSDSEKVKAAEEAISALQREMRNASRQIDYQSRSREDSVREVATKIQERMKAVQEKIEGAQNALKIHAEKASVKALLDECKQRVTDTEAAVKAAVEAEAAFNKASAPDGNKEEESSALSTLEAAIKAANSAFNNTKSSLGVKRVNVKRMAPELSGPVLEELDSLQKRLDEEAGKLSQSKKIVAERQHEVVKRELNDKMKTVDTLFEASKAAFAKLTVEEDLSPDELTSRCKAGGSAVKAASAALETLQRLLQSRQNEMRRSGKELEPAAIAEVQEMLKKAEVLEGELQSQRNELRSQEDKLSSKKLLKESYDLVDALEAKMKDAEKIAAPITDENVSCASSVHLQNIIEAFNKSITRTSGTSEALIAKLVVDDKVPEEGFITFCQELPELLVEEGVPLFSDEELKGAYKALLGGEGEQVTKADLADKFKIRHTVINAVAMTDRLAIRGGKTVRKLAMHEVLESLAETEKDMQSGLNRVKCKADKDGKEGFVTVAAINGTRFLEPFSAVAAMTQKIDHAVNEMTEALRDTAKTLDQRMGNVKGGSKGGATAETKAEITKQLRPRIAAVQLSLNTLKKKLTSTRQVLSETEANESGRRQEALDRSAAAKIVKSSQQAAETVRKLSAEALPPGEKLAGQPLSENEKDVEALLAAERGLVSLSETIAEARSQLDEAMNRVRYARQGPLAEAWTTAHNLLSEVTTKDERCKEVLGTIQVQRKKLAADARAAVATALREAAVKEGLGVEALFDKLRKESPTIPTKELVTFLGAQALKGAQDLKSMLNAKGGELELGVERYASSGFTKLALMLVVQDYMKCVKEIAMTDGFDVKESKTVKKLAIGELVEVFETKKPEDDSDMTRVRCRAVGDLTEGWVSLKGTQGTNFMERCAKPFFCCREELSIQSAFESGSAEVKRLLPGQVVEVMEGPRREAAAECLRARGRATKDGKLGFITISGGSEDCIEKLKAFVCKQGTALTTEFDIKTSKSIRKLEVGEVMEVLEEAKEDSKKGLFRLKVKCYKDGKEGWATLKGNQGTSFVEESDRHHTVKKSVALEVSFRSGSATVRSLEEGEIFEMLDAPKTEKKEGDQRMRGRLSDDTEGWFTFTKFLNPWSPRYRCLKSTDLCDGLDASAKVVRPLNPGELVEALDLPKLDAASGLVRVQIRAEKDNSVGFATIRDGEGAVLMDSLSPERPADR